MRHHIDSAPVELLRCSLNGACHELKGVPLGIVPVLRISNSRLKQSTSQQEALPIASRTKRVQAISRESGDRERGTRSHQAGGMRPGGGGRAPVSLMFP